VQLDAGGVETARESRAFAGALQEAVKALLQGIGQD
jgi:hypothetical protein